MSTGEKKPQASPEPNNSEISSGSGAPDSTPTKVGNIYVDTNGAKAYISAGTSASTDWKILN